jgi:hypothetical protein
LNLCLDAFSRAGADPDHGNDGCHADDDAEHRQCGPRAIHLQRAQRNTRTGQQLLHDVTRFQGVSHP